MLKIHFAFILFQLLNVYSVYFNEWELLDPIPEDYLADETIAATYTIEDVVFQFGGGEIPPNAIIDYDPLTNFFEEETIVSFNTSGLRSYGQSYTNTILNQVFFLDINGNLGYFNHAVDILERDVLEIGLRASCLTSKYFFDNRTLHIYFIGGDDRNSTDVLLPSTRVYRVVYEDDDEPYIEELAPLLLPRINFTCQYISRDDDEDLIYAIGGNDDSIEVYHVDLNFWSYLTQKADFFSFYQSSVVVDNDIYILGGENLAGTRTNLVRFLNTTENSITNERVGMITSKSRFVVSYLRDINYLYTLGGSNETGFVRSERISLEKIPSPAENAQRIDELEDEVANLTVQVNYLENKVDYLKSEMYSIRKLVKKCCQEKQNDEFWDIYKHIPNYDYGKHKHKSEYEQYHSEYDNLLNNQHHDPFYAGGFGHQ